MDILHGVETCRPTTPRGLVRVVLVYAAQGTKPTIIAYQAIASDFDSTALKAIADEHKKTGRNFVPNIAVHTGLESEVAKMVYVDTKSGWITNDRRNSSRETSLEQQIRAAILQAKQLCNTYEATGKKPQGLHDVMERILPESIVCTG